MLLNVLQIEGLCRDHLPIGCDLAILANALRQANAGPARRRRSEVCSAGVPPAVTGASRSRKGEGPRARNGRSRIGVRARCPHHSGRDARATIEAA